MRVDLPRCPQVVRLASAFDADKSPLSVRMLSALGALHATWSLFDTHSADGLMRGYSLDAIDVAIGVSGWGRVMAEVGWLVVSPCGVTVPEWEKHNGTSSKRRSEDAQRKRAERTKTGQTSAAKADAKRTLSSSSSTSLSSLSPEGEPEREPGFPWPAWVSASKRDGWVQEIYDGTFALRECRSSPAFLDGVRQAISQYMAPAPGDTALDMVCREDGAGPVPKVVAWLHELEGYGVGYITAALWGGPLTDAWQLPRFAADAERAKAGRRKGAKRG